ncbi:unnamed protein product [Adineta steineri]|uniref:Retrotransposon gag domain-containing protein n=1 Tax=Adineta steineri TaxID=433720 RepID=A0A815I510_9BILA|nr:unnamed protein product [Adineta steineri]CAF3760325.1 unnamed protein product [Adineta steineri]
MDNTDRITAILKSFSRGSSQEQYAIDADIFISTKIQSTTTKKLHNKDRRNAIIPTPSRPKNKQDLLTMYSKEKTNNKERIVTLIDNRSASLIRQSSIFANNDTHDAEVTNNNDGKSTIISDSFVNFETDQALSDLYKDIVGDLIKNPKTFKGNKDDVNKWFDDIEHLLNITHISDAIRLDIISYSLRGNALEWFKNNRSSFTTWNFCP